MVRAQRQAGAAVLAVDGEDDLQTEEQFAAALDKAVRERPDMVVVDLTGLSFPGSLGPSQLVEASAATDALRVVAVDSPRQAAETTGLGLLFRNAKTVDEALG